MDSCKTVLDYLDRQTAVQPEAIAVSDQVCSYSFAQLNHYSDVLASVMLQRGIQQQAVGVAARRSAQTVLLFFAVLKTGGFYVPLDPDWKPEKLSQVCHSAGLTLILDTQTPGLNTDDVQTLLCDQFDTCQPESAQLQQIRAQMGPKTPLYLIYTSGSTGVPKGVLKTHGAMLSYIQTFTSHYSLQTSDVLGNQTPFFFDASAKDIYWMLHDGCRLEVLDTGLFSQPYKLIQYMNDHHITVISWVPSALAIVTQLNTFADILPQDLHSVFFIGEVFPMRQFLAWRAALPQVRFVNLYGQSELAGACCYYEVDRDFAPEETLPIGRSLENANILLYKDGQPVTQPGQVGEIYIVSAALAEGYYADPEKTAEAFVTLTLDGEPVRAFRTGDLARYNDEGLLVFAARQDAQIKHMGYRIELGEIEAAANSLPQIIDCACLFDKEKDKIVLFCTAQPDVTKAMIRKALREKLSAYMVPSKVEILPQLPRNANGKTDRVALKSYLTKGANKDHG